MYNIKDQVNALSTEQAQRINFSLFPADLVNFFQAPKDSRLFSYFTMRR